LKRKERDGVEEGNDAKRSSSMPPSENSQSVVEPPTINGDLLPEPMASCKDNSDIPVQTLESNNSTMTTNKEPGYCNQCN
jgi:hypothetical protein